VREVLEISVYAALAHGGQFLLEVRVSICLKASNTDDAARHKTPEQRAFEAEAERFLDFGVLDDGVLNFFNGNGAIVVHIHLADQFDRAHRPFAVVRLHLAQERANLCSSKCR
jgi:hypothetical protein